MKDTLKSFREKRRKERMRYCRGPGVPSKLPDGTVLVHNQVIPEAGLGMSGFRAWTQLKTRDLERCRCDFGGCKNADLHKHYRVQFGDTPKERRAYRAGNAACQEVMATWKGAPDGKLWERWQALRKRAAKASTRAFKKAMAE
jgi:hypothetical protein